MSNTIAYGRALFYPHIDFHNDVWVKTAALYYKGLNRIVPDGYMNSNNSEIIKRLNENEEFVKNINPVYAAGEIADDFLDFAERELANPARREKLIHSVQTKLPTNKTFKIHMGKIGYRLQEWLPSLGLAVKPTDTDFWFEFEPITGAIYMTCLANYLAKEDKIPVVTDEPAFHPLIRGIQFEEFTANRDIGEILASIVIKSSVPQNLESIPIEKILKFRNNYDDERHLFYNEINKLVKDLETLDNQDALQDALKARIKDIDIAVNNLDKALKGMGISTVVALLGLSVPSFASDLGFIMAAAGVVTIAAGKLIGYGFDHYRSKQNSPYSYVLSLRHKLEAETFAEQLWRGKILL